MNRFGCKRECVFIIHWTCKQQDTFWVEVSVMRKQRLFDLESYSLVDCASTRSWWSIVALPFWRLMSSGGLLESLILMVDSLYLVRKFDFQRNCTTTFQGKLRDTVELLYNERLRRPKQKELTDEEVHLIEFLLYQIFYVFTIHGGGHPLMIA